jgi:hypothetical protein
LVRDSGKHPAADPPEDARPPPAHGLRCDVIQRGRWSSSARSPRSAPGCAFLGGWNNLGVPLSCGKSEVDVFVPPGTMRLKVLSGAQRLASGLPEEPEVLGELEHEAKPGEQPVLNVVVGAPAEVK